MITLLLLALPCAYALLVWRLGSALASPWTPRAPRDSGDLGEGISVIVPARNEEALLEATLSTLAAQTLPRARWELLVVDDGSRDGTAAAAGRALEGLRAAGVEGRLLTTTPARCGKKAAIDLAIGKSRHEWVAVLDADSRPAPGWLEALLEAARPRTGLLAGPVLFEGEGFFPRLARLEYAGLLGAGLASFALGRALFASGANLCYRRAAYHDAGGYAGLEHVASADDTLLIQRLRLRTSWRLEALLDPRALVRTRAPATLKEFWGQRVRWTSTERHLPDRAAQAAALALYGVFLLTALALPAAALGWVSPALAAALVLLKALPDFRLVRHAAARLGTGDLALFPLAWAGQLAYGLLAPWAGTFGRVRWRPAAASPACSSGGSA